MKDHSYRLPEVILKVKKNVLRIEIFIWKTEISE